LSALPRDLAGRYTVRAPIGEGAFSVTYRAIDNTLQREVAIKVLREQYASHKGFDSRFEREARSAARISHPNVIPVYDYGRHGNLPYIIMQFVDGPNLKEYVREDGPLTIEEAMHFARQILDGLAAIHDEGIIHRDVKPQNVLIDEGMQAKITDFGVAFATVDPGLTETGMAVGTAAYMAPEQASGESVGPQADLYAVGVILYELLTGRLPFQGENPVQVMYRHVNEMPEPPRSLNRSVPLGVEAVVLKALSKDPYDRFADARTMRDALITPGSAAARTATTPVVAQPEVYRTAERPGVAQPPPRRRSAPPRRRAPARRSSNWPVVLLLLLVIGLVLVLLLLLQSDRFTGFATGAEATPTEQTAQVVEPEPTETSTPEPTLPAVVNEPEPIATSTSTAELIPDTPVPAEPEPTATEGVEVDPTPAPLPPTPTETSPEPPSPPQIPAPPASGQFNAPFDARLLPPQWTSGTSISLTAEQFMAGGASGPGEAFVVPGAQVVDRVDVEFNALKDPSSYIGITMAAMRASDQGQSPMRLSLNGNTIWTGPAPFSAGEWTEVGWRLGNLGWLQDGMNVLTVEILSTGDSILVWNTTVFYG
jgi:eukaryotic-like serine/threonine-protein kinase